MAIRATPRACWGSRATRCAIGSRKWGSNKALIERLVQKRQDLWPHLVGDLFVESPQRIVRSHESVPRSGMNRDRDVLTHCLQLRFESFRLIGRKEVVLFGHVAA